MFKKLFQIFIYLIVIGNSSLILAASSSIPYKDKSKNHERNTLIEVRQPEFRNVYINGVHFLYPGMFSVFNTVIGCLDLFEQKNYAGITVDFENKGLYYDPQMGLNWWNYYCEPIKIQKRPSQFKSIFTFDKCTERAFHTEEKLTRERIFELISRYVKFKPSVIETVDQFFDENFLGHTVIGIHYRGTDKEFEAPKLQYQKIVDEIKAYTAFHELLDFKVFVATDEAPFLEYMKEAFPDRISYSSAERATDNLPLHYYTKNPYQQGLESIIDCFLLSKADVLFRTSSNLSLWSTYLNPQLPVYLLSERHIDFVKGI